MIDAGEFQMQFNKSRIIDRSNGPRRNKGVVVHHLQAGCPTGDVVVSTILCRELEVPLTKSD